MSRSPGQPAPRPARGGAMLTLLRLPSEPVSRLPDVSADAPPIPRFSPRAQWFRPRGRKVFSAARPFSGTRIEDGCASRWHGPAPRTSSRTRASTHKFIALTEVRFIARRGLKSDIAGGPKTARAVGRCGERHGRASNGWRDGSLLPDNKGPEACPQNR